MMKGAKNRQLDILISDSNTKIKKLNKENRNLELKIEQLQRKCESKDEVYLKLEKQYKKLRHEKQ